MKYTPDKKAMKISIIVVCAALLLTVGLAGAYIYKSRHPARTLASLSFRQFRPTVLPDGVKITNKKLIASTDRHGKLQDLTLFLTLNLPDNSSVSEEKSDGSEKCNFHNVDTGKQMCRILKTPKGQIYSYLPNRYKDKSMNSDEVRFIKGGTVIFMRVNANEEGFFTERQWQTMIDSFVPIDFKLRPEYREPAI